MSEINLLKNELKGSSFSFAPKSMTPLYIAIGVLVFEALLYGGMMFFEHSLEKQKSQLDVDAAGIESEINRSSENVNAAQSVQKRLTNLRVLLDNHVFWSQVFNELEKYTYKPIVYSTLEADVINGQFRISGLSSSYTDLGKLILGLRQSPNVTDVTLQSTSRGREQQSGYFFNLEISFDPKLFIK